MITKEKAKLLNQVIKDYLLLHKHSKYPANIIGFYDENYRLINIKNKTNFSYGWFVKHKIKFVEFFNVNILYPISRYEIYSDVVKWYYYHSGYDNKFSPKTLLTYKQFQDFVILR